MNKPFVMEKLQHAYTQKPDTLEPLKHGVLVELYGLPDVMQASGFMFNFLMLRHEENYLGRARVVFAYAVVFRRCGCKVYAMRRQFASLDTQKNGWRDLREMAGPPAPQRKQNN